MRQLKTARCIYLLMHNYCLVQRSNANKRVYVENKYRPVFYKCGSASLDEGKLPGTVVSEVKAYDNDTDSAGEIVFTILRAGSEKEFEVDPVTGVIRSSKVN